MVYNIIVSGGIGAVTFAASVISDATHIPLGEGIAVGVFACTLTYWLTGRLQRIDDRMEANEERHRTAFEELNRRLDSLPCDKRECKKESP